MQKRNGPSNPQHSQEMRTLLNEKQWRQYLAIEAHKRGSVTEVAKGAGVSRNTVKRGWQELEAGDLYRPGERLRKTGGGRKKEVERDAMLQADLESLLDPQGDPMSLLRWTAKSLEQLVKALTAKGHQIKKSALADLLHEMGFSLRAKKKEHRGDLSSRSRCSISPHQRAMPAV